MSIEDVRESKVDQRAVTGEVHRVYYLVITHEGLICEIYRDEAGSEGMAAGWWQDHGE